MVRMAEPVKSCLYELYLKIVFWFRGRYCPHIAVGKTPITIPLATLLSDLTRAPNVHIVNDEAVPAEESWMLIDEGAELMNCLWLVMDYNYNEDFRILIIRHCCPN